MEIRYKCENEKHHIFQIEISPRVILVISDVGHPDIVTNFTFGFVKKEISDILFDLNLKKSLICCLDISLEKIEKRTPFDFGCYEEIAINFINQLKENLGED